MLRVFTAYGGLSLVACAGLLLLLVAGLERLPSMRVDLTQERLYTLGAGSKQLAREISEPISLKLYFSQAVSGELPQLRDYSQRIYDLLLEYQEINPNNIIVEKIDPIAFSDAEDEATLAGLRSAPVSLGGETLFLGLIAERSGDETSREVIDFFNPERERFLEYDVSQVIYKLGKQKPLSVGVFSDAPLFGGYGGFGMQQSAPWTVITQLQQIASVSPVLEEDINEQLDVLLVVHPERVSDQAAYAIEQYLLNGGRGLFFVDPNAEVLAQGPGGGSSSTLAQLFDQWGLQYDSEQVVGDLTWGLRIPVDETSAPLPHVGILGLPADAMDQNSIITTELESINIASSGSLSLADNSPLSWTPLLQTTTNAKQFTREEYNSADNHGQLLVDYNGDGQRLVLAAKIKGEVSASFTEYPEPKVEEGAETDTDGEKTAEPPQRPAHIESGTINAIVVADVDILSDRLWVQVSNLFGQRVVMPWANNGDFLLNAVENLGGSEALISLRSRGQYSRPFTVVNQLRNEAAEAFKQEEQILLDRLKVLEESIASVNAPLDGEAEVVLSPEQQGRN